MDHREFENCSHRVPYCAAKVRAAGCLSHDERVNAKSGAVTHNDADILGIGQTVDGYEKMRPGTGCENVGERPLRRNLAKPHDPLMQRESDDGFDPALWREKDIDGPGLEKGFEHLKPFGRHENRSDCQVALE